MEPAKGHAEINKAIVDSILRHLRRRKTEPRP